MGDDEVGGGATPLADVGLAAAVASSGRPSGFDDNAIKSGDAVTIEGVGDDNEGPLYRLFAVVVHVGSGPNHGHYVSLIRSRGKWLCFDDETVEKVPETQLAQFFGTGGGGGGGTEHGYILFYANGTWTINDEE